MENDRTDVLIAKYFDGTLTEDERAELMRSYDLQSSREVDWMAESHDEAVLVKYRMLSNIKQEIFPVKKRIFQATLSRIISAAAILLVITAMGWLFLKPSSKPGVATQDPNIAKIKPGTNTAILTLPTGRQIELDQLAKGKTVEKDGIRIQKTKEGEVVFTVTPQGISQTKLSTISTPKGGQYQVVLPDGTKVWLNSASSIEFPAVFTGKERKVRLEGEGYFEVAKSKAMPFKVKTALQEIEVLGTHFNIMAYDNENSIQTTLLEGSVRVLSGTAYTVLKPGQQAELNKTDRRIAVNEVSVKSAIAWKNGIFMFAHEDMHSILNKISRWYDVEIVYKNTAANHKYSGTISRFEEVTEVLKTMEMTGTVHFEIKGRRIYVMD